MVPAVNEANRTAILDAVMASPLPTNARLVINIDIVKPMPPNKPAPKICFQFNPAGNLQIPIVTAIKHSNIIPSGLPNNNPPIMPRLFLLVNSCAQFSPMTTPVFASAKMGKITKATGLCKKCCKI